MNRSYRLVWNERIGAWVVASECARARGKRSGAVRAAALACLLGTSTAWAVDPAALPSGGQIVSGSGSISQNGAAMTVNQGSDKLIANWNSFNIGSQASVNFAQPGAASVALNRVVGSDPSYLFGHLTANGKVFLINPSGVIFGQSARVDVGGLVASTLGLGDQDFLSGNYRFINAGGAGSVLNQGRISGKVVALLGPRVSNQGSIAAPGGTVALAAGDRVSLDFAGDGLLTANVQQAAVNALAENKGLIQADGGTVVMTAKSAGDLLATVVNNEGIIQAHGLSQHDGRIVLDGGDVGVTRAAGTLDVSNAGGKGGSIVVTGDKVLIDEGARLDATGATGGGEIFAGGGWQGGDPSIRQASATTVARSALLDASATGNGNGGTVVAWSDVHDANSATRAFGTFRANGGANGGDGGRIETSGHWLDTQGAQGSAAAPAGKSGSWLLDPYDITISTSASSNGAFTTGNWAPSGSGSTILNTDIDALLNGGTSVAITTSGAGAEAGDITVNAPVTKSSGSSDVTLTLAAEHSILVNQSITNTGGTGKLNVVLDSNSADGGSGGILMTPGTAIVTNGGDITLSGGSNTATGFALGAANTGDRGIWTQQNTVLDASGTASGGNIVLRSKGTTTGEGMLIGWGGSGPASTIKTNGSGTISMTGTGGGQSGGRWVTGVSLWNTAIQTGSGAINISGTGGAADGTDDNSGVLLDTNSVTTDDRIVSVSGPINITGVRGTGTTSLGAGIWFNSGSHQIGQDGTLVGSSSSNITLKTDTLKIDSGSLQSSGALAIQPYTASTTIGVGAGSGTLALTQGYFWNGSSGNIKDGFSGITIGRADGTGAIDVNGLSFSDPLTLLGGAGVNATLAGTIANAGSGTASGSLTVKVGGDISSAAAITTQNQAVLFNADSDASGAGAIALNAGSSITSNGGNVTLGGGADPTQNAATGTAFGVALNSGATINAGGGNISMVGQGGTDDTNAGVNLNFGSSVQTTGNGSITITGTGGSAGTYRNGVMLDRASVSAQNGGINITGTAGAGASSNGITQQVSGSVTSNGNGAINITGIGANGILTTGTSQFGGPSATGAITLSADSMSLASTTSVQGTGALLIQPHTAGTTIGVGDGAGGTLSLAGSTLDALADGFSSITIGNADASAIDARGYTFKDALALQNGNNIFIRGALATGSGSQAGSITVRTTGSILLDSTPVGSITTQGQSVVLDADSDGNQNGNIRLLYGSSIASNGGAITLGGGADPATTAAWGNTAGGHVSDMSGVYIEHTTINSGGGDIGIRGSGASAGAVADSAGVMIENGSTINSGTGKIAITGIGSLGGATGNMGVNIRYQDAFGKASAGGSTITSASTAADAIVINGIGSTTGAANSAGVTVQNGSSINATGAGGGIAISGTGGTGADGANHGIFFDTNTALNLSSGNLALTGTGGSGAQGLDFTGTSTIGSAASSGAFTFNANTMNFGGGAITGTGALLIQPLTVSTSIGIGNSASGTLNLAGSELDKLADGFSSITIGSAAGSGAVDVRGYTFKDPLTIRTPAGSGSIAVNGALATGSASQAGSIALTAGGAIAFGASGSVTTQGSDVTATAGSKLTMPTGSAITTNGGNFSGTFRAMTVSDAISGSISTGAGNLSLTGTDPSHLRFVGASLGTTTGNLSVSVGNNTSTGSKIELYSGASFTTQTGNITLTQTDSNGWIIVGADSGGASIGATGIGNITLNNSSGSYLRNGGSITAAGGAVTLAAVDHAFADIGSFTISNPTGTVAISGGITEGASGSLAAGALKLSGAGAFNLAAGTNTVGTLAAAGTSSINLKNSGSLTAGSVGGVDGVTASGDITLEAGGATADLTLSKPVTTTSGTIIAAAGRNFINTNAANTGLVPGSGRYLVYSANPANSTEGMTGYSKHYNQAYTAGSTPAYAGSDNWFLYSVAPTLSVAPGAQTISYGDAAPGFTPAYSGFIDGDAAGSAGISGTATFSIGGTTSSAGKYSAGSHDIDYVSGLASSLGYQIQNDSASTGELTVNAKTLSLSGFAADSKIYDGATTASISNAGALSGIVSGDTVTVGNSGATFADKNVGSGKTVTLNGVSLGGTDGGNYSIVGSATATADITAKTLTLSGFSANNKVYDGTTTASIGNVGSLSGVVAGDTVTVGNSGATFADKNVGSGKTVTLNGISLGGTNGGNYSIAASATDTADITPRPLAAGLIGSVTKIQDGTTTAALASGNFNLSGFVAGEGAAVSQTAGHYDNPNIGTGKTVTAALAAGDFHAGNGTQLSNYTLPATASGVIGSITSTATLGNTLSDATVNQAHAVDTSGTAGAATHADIGASMQSAAGGSGNLVMNNTPRQSGGGMTLSTSDGAHPVTFSGSGGTTTLNFGDASAGDMHSESLLQVYIADHGHVQPLKSFSVIDQGSSLALEPSASLQQAVPDIASVHGRTTTGSLALPDGGEQEFRLQLSQDGVLLIRLPNGGLHDLKEQQLVLLALATAKGNLGIPPSQIKAVVITGMVR